MELKECTVLPGAIINVDDPKKLGRVKASVPTLFDTSTMSEDALPWISLANMPGQQHFSKMVKGEKIWVLYVPSSREYWYWPMFELHEDVRKLIDDYDDAEVLLARSSGDSSVYIYYNNTDGINIKVGEEASINISTDSQIHIKAADGVIDINDSKIHIGKTEHENEEPAAKGDAVYECINALLSWCKAMQPLTSSPYVSALAPAWSQSNVIQTVQQNLSKIKAENTFVN